MNVKVLGIGLLLVGLWVVMAIAVPESFLTGNNIENLLRRTAMYGVLGIGVAFVIITAGIDLSIGSIVCLSGCLSPFCFPLSTNPSRGNRSSPSIRSNKSSWSRVSPNTSKLVIPCAITAAPRPAAPS